MQELQWVKPLLAADVPEGSMPVWDQSNQVWTFVPREIWNAATTFPTDSNQTSSNT